MSQNHPIAYCAPGAGLGHLTRACAVCTHLARMGTEPLILTNSPFATGISRIMGCSISYIPTSRWKDDLPRYVARHGARLVVLDTFPWGMRGEWAVESPFPDISFVYLARRIKLSVYLDAIGVKWEGQKPQVSHAIITEPLSREHETLLLGDCTDFMRLPGRIRLPDSLAAPPPARRA